MIGRGINEVLLESEPADNWPSKQVYTPTTLADLPMASKPTSAITQFAFNTQNTY